MNTIDNQLKQLKACQEAINWAKGKTWEEIYNTCQRADWILWLFNNTNEDHRLLTLAIGHCANTLRHLIKDEISIYIIDDAIAYGEGKKKRNWASGFYASCALSVWNIYGNAKMENKTTADICRKYLPIEIWNVTFDK